MINRLSAIAGIPKPHKIAIMDIEAPNAFATGRNKKKATVAVTTGLLNKLTDQELEAVIGHELAHIKNRDVAVMTWASLIVVIAGYLMQMMFWMSLFGGFGGGSRRESGGQVWLMIMIIPALQGKSMAKLLSSHPQTEERVRRLRNINKNMTNS